MSSSLDPLDSALQQWRQLEPPRIGTVRGEVWRRIADADSRSGPTRFSERIEALFRQTGFSVAFVAACLVLGLFLAELRVSAATADHNRRLLRDYARLIDPRMTHLTALPPAPLPR